MKATKLATSLTIGTFIVTLITGLALTLELGSSAMRPTHEWLGLAFGAFGVFHALTYKKRLFSHFKDSGRLVIAAALLCGGILFTVSMGDIHVSSVSYEKLSQTSLRHLAPVLGITGEELITHLKELGVTITDTNQSLVQVAVENKLEVHAVMEPLLSM